MERGLVGGVKQKDWLVFRHKMLGQDLTVFLQQLQEQRRPEGEIDNQKTTGRRSPKVEFYSQEGIRHEKSSKEKNVKSEGTTK